MIKLTKKQEYIDQRIKKSTSCWEWTGSISVAGYGIANFNKKRFPAHRIVYEMMVGKIPKGLQIDHLCRNRKCVNPSHLEAVDQKTNILRGVGTSALNSKKKKCPKCNGQYDVRSNGDRWCRACFSKYMASYRKEWTIRNPYKNREYRRTYMAKKRAQLNKLNLE